MREQMDRIKPGSRWRRKSGGNLAIVESVTPFENNGIVLFRANWSKTGWLRKAVDSFLSHYVPVGATHDRD